MEPLRKLPIEAIRTPESSPLNPTGVVLLVMHAPTGLIWTNRELQEKVTTDRFVKSLSIPSETSKVGEPPLATTAHGMIGEFTGTNQLSDIAPRLHLAYFNPHFLTHTSQNEHTLQVGFGLVLYDGPLQQMRPHATEEVSPHGWVHIEELTSGDDIRPLTQHVVTEVLNQKIISQALTNHQEGKSITFHEIFAASGIDIFDRDAMEQAVSIRQSQPDVAIYPSYPRRAS